MNIEYVLLGSDNGDLVWWSNDYGWGDRASATSFTHDEMEAFNEPMGTIGWQPNMENK